MDNRVESLLLSTVIHDFSNVYKFSPTFNFHKDVENCGKLFKSGINRHLSNVCFVGNPVVIFFDVEIS